MTGGNPRVQANALIPGKSIEEVLVQLGPGQTTVADQIACQLDAAMLAVRDRHVDQSQIDAICRGLANLPPFVPLEVLAKAANVDVSTVHSFISDLGRPLWHTDDAVQFRDEPTETWFRENYSATKEQVVAYLAALEPLAKQYTYVAKVLPQLLLRSENYDRLVRLALSDDFLPENNAIDERDIRLYRLQFAFRAALRLGRVADAIRLAFRAGEEAAGNERQLSLLQANLHLIAPLQGAHRIQELAYRRAFGSAWEGSQNVFSGSLLSAVKDFHGEARTYLRAAQKWLDIYFTERANTALSCGPSLAPAASWPSWKSVIGTEDMSEQHSQTPGSRRDPPVIDYQMAGDAHPLSSCHLLFGSFYFLATLVISPIAYEFTWRFLTGWGPDTGAWQFWLLGSLVTTLVVGIIYIGLRRSLRRHRIASAVCACASGSLSFLPGLAIAMLW